MFDEVRRNKALTAIAHDYGPQATIVLFNLIDNFPQRMQLLDGQAVMKADPGAPTKLHLDSKRYYELIAALQGKGLVAEIRTDDKKFYYAINWEKLDSYFPQEEGKEVQYELLEDSD